MMTETSDLCFWFAGLQSQQLTSSSMTTAKKHSHPTTGPLSATSNWLNKGRSLHRLAGGQHRSGAISWFFFLGKCSVTSVQSSVSIISAGPRDVSMVKTSRMDLRNRHTHTHTSRTTRKVDGATNSGPNSQQPTQKDERAKKKKKEKKKRLKRCNSVA